MNDTPRSTNNLPALVAAAAAALCGWVVAGWWEQSSFSVPAVGTPLKSATRLLKASASASTGEVLRRLAEMSIPDGATMDLKAILALRSPASGHPALDLAVEDCLLAELIKHDPHGALDAAIHGVPGHPPDQLVSRLLHLWLQQDFDGAVAAVSGLPHSLMVSQRWALARAVGRANPQKAIEMAENGEVSWLEKNFRELFREALPRLAEINGNMAMDLACRKIQPESRFGSNLYEYGETIQPALHKWLKHDPAAARRWMAEHKDDNQGGVGIAVAAAVLQTDAKEGMRLMEEAIARRKELKPGDWVASGQWREIAGAIAAANPEAALARARELPADDPLRQFLLATAACEAGAKLPVNEKLALLAEGLAAREDKKDVHKRHWRIGREIVGTMQQLAAEDPQAALRQAKVFPDAALATAAVLSHVMQFRSDSELGILREALAEPESAAAIAKAVSEDLSGIGSGSPMDYAPILARVPEARVLINGEVLEQWVVANPAAASGFLTEELRAGHAPPPGSQRLVAQWALNDSAAAAAWVEKLPAGEFRKLAEENLVNTWARTNPTAAQSWREKAKRK